MKGRWTYLYRAIDRDGNLVDVLLREKRDEAAAEAFFRSARTVTGSIPERVTTDGHEAYPGAITAELRERGCPRTHRSFNNHLEQDRRGSKPRTQPMGEFKQAAEALIVLSDGNRKGTANLLAEVEKAGLWISMPSYEQELTSRTDSHSPASSQSAVPVLVPTRPPGPVCSRLW